ncbi:bifunctional biotin--[acetyl-CoA-carboxylase] ligase/biotin operon repressor BirA [Streptococcus pseudoporcinus]|uniref:Bifunctional ligase/repressor BirA n=1 Tax=Streptococcus pseudoporcinus TaxID=361101 RepID=A0A4U9XK01_9STRE|nr:bifunctional biotin--[acetyl-CoA-carboxylase] ligase/biotin operon repressor BirA [Streptococcus pseudoporcinus]VTS12818.1 BirA bifunctional protein [Streptococcus pseudoporcinus]VUC65719.1 BirA bifunctional protein [Streptococcus pseudoporcinus]VUC96640.1 BirA bifunctional protein [Streptococcus pseudoporcinus]VUC97032.1 BirA bifunctional protein [Streptococcus pseudoporcinus]
MKTSEKIYTLLNESNQFVSGEVLADKMNLSRTSIWKAIKSLENQGLVIEKSKVKGYKLLRGDLLLPNQISQAIGFPVTLTANSISTQKDAKDSITANGQTPHLFLATNQKKAKGRMNRDFFTSNTGGIYMSLHLKPNVTYAQLNPYTLMVASSIVKAISRLTGIETQIKWVNDIYLGQKKIAGIITEAITSVETGLITDVIIGLGLNFDIPSFPDEISSKAGSLFQGNAPINRNQLIIEIWDLFFNIPVKDHLKVYKEKSLVIDREISFLEKEQLVTARAIDITDQGHLVVQLADGQEQILRSGEISLSSW